MALNNVIQMHTEQPLATYGNPQKENGYTPIANELLEQIISFDFTKRELLIVLAIARMTYGYNRKTDALSTIQISHLLKMNRPDVSKSLNKLIEMNVIIKHESGRKSHGFFVNELSINKHYNDWVTGSKSHTDSKSLSDSKSLPLTGSKSPTKQVVNHHTHKAIKTIKQYIPENPKKRTSKTLIPSDFSVSERVKVWAEKNGYKNLDVHLENFILAANAKAYTYADWDSAFMGAIRNNWAKVHPDSDKSKKPDWLKV